MRTMLHWVAVNGSDRPAAGWPLGTLPPWVPPKLRLFFLAVVELRLSWIAAQSRRILARALAGKLPKPRASGAIATRRPSGPRQPWVHPAAPQLVKDDPAAFRLPRQAAWLGAFARGSGVFGAHLTLLLAEPEMADAVARSPTLRRLLRSLLRMLGTELPEGLRPMRAARAKLVRPRAAVAAADQVSDEERFDDPNSVVGSVPGRRKWPGWTRRRLKGRSTASLPPPDVLRNANPQGEREEKPELPG